MLGLLTEDLERDQPAQSEVAAGGSGGAGEARVGGGRDPRPQALRRAEPGDREGVVPVEQPLPRDVDHQPRPEVEAVAEARVDGVLEVRVRVDEARDDRGLVEAAVGGAELVHGPDGGDAPVFDRDGAALDRRRVDRQHPVGGVDLTRPMLDRLTRRRPA